MAMSDYRLCDVCDGKAFYDLNLNYEQSYELGFLHGAAAERKAIIDIVAFHGGSVEIEADIRSRGES